VRLEAACRLLETTRVPVEQVARACGFGTPETLHRSFRRRFGSHRIRVGKSESSGTNSGHRECGDQEGSGFHNRL